jgi:hypothetical protein
MGGGLSARGLVFGSEEAQAIQERDRKFRAVADVLDLLERDGAVDDALDALTELRWAEAHAEEGDADDEERLEDFRWQLYEILKPVADELGIAAWEVRKRLDQATC